MQGKASAWGPPDGGATAAGRGGYPGGRGGRGGRGGGRGRYGGRGSISGGGSGGRNVVDSSGQPPICRFYLQGRCSFGTQCRYRHDGGLQDSATNGGTPPLAAAAAAYGGPSHPQSSSAPRAGGRGGSRREFDPNRARAISRAKAAQDAESRPWSAMTGPFYSIDVECVAIGYGHSASQRIPSRIAMVDGEGRTVIDEVVRHDADTATRIVSYLTPLTGLTREGCEVPTNKTLEEISELIRDKLPKDAILVGQSIHHDIEWLDLVKGVDYGDYVDLADIFRQRIPKVLISAGNAVKREGDEKGEVVGVGAVPEKKGGGSTTSADDATVGFPTRYRIFGLRHCCVHLLSVDMQSSHHDPVDDARYSILLFNKYRTAEPPLLRAVRDSLHRAPITPGFSVKNPVVDGVCMSRAGYVVKHSARFIWRWWTKYSGRKGVTDIDNDT
eukprot:CAMPEP_0178729234 /NCGR_PEP_ID=MMETSP0699-20121125/28856_1 /TAXON_ID=265572 /ORGANISM="Extubocellulus spinifer, Strain CCMP396" /LENGTH=441 /DNA_ID=CAMNT_0020381137 /DNA_START=2671 /DNA_END=3996 /DNA_ORIENTATION=+